MRVFPAGRALLAVVIGVFAVAVFATPGRPQNVTGTIEDFLKREINPLAGADIEIAPMQRKGSPEPGRWNAIPNDIFGGILARSGITPCVSDPKRLRGRPGFLEFEKSSQVVNPGGTRATFGWFVRTKRDVSDFAVDVEYFILMSYDVVFVEDIPICAFEVFLFGPIPRSGSPVVGLIGGGVTPLIAGLAVDGNGNTLDAVPPTIAKVVNFDKTAGGDELVLPGVGVDGVGCFRCHGRDDDFPQSTTPFPWTYDFNKP